jgi:hypothetical protein
MDMRGPRKRDQHVHIEEIRHSSSSAANVSSSVVGLALAGTTKHGDTFGDGYRPGHLIHIFREVLSAS